MEVLLCRDCERKPAAASARLSCDLCKKSVGDTRAVARARAFAAAGGRDGEGEGAEAAIGEDSGAGARPPKRARR